jgi:hypothetical protein
MLIKLDLSKSFDKLSWKYMRALLLAFGFSEIWVNWIMSLTSSPSSQCLINGVPSKPFSPSRGIQQGTLFPPSSLLLWLKGLVSTSKKLSMRVLSKVSPFMDHTPPFLIANLWMTH